MNTDDILARARAGKAGEVTISECIYLKKNLDPSVTYPIYCNSLINNASKAGLLSRRNSRVAQAWDLTDGHGVRKMNSTEVSGYYDSNPADDKSVHEVFLESKTPEEREKINKLHVRLASRGAKPRNDYDAFVASKATQQAVVEETHSELVRRASRRKEMSSKDVHTQEVTPN